ncbi:hypothetical protein HIM_05534 [Hirsutella minnesotensis 3608]|uniref:Uncharacterized protein n=1 Tax=Hirsutella minnesotensis 3608 TaxID=1043627 RepID=A0A0F7ZUL0_9HYPO|nr:hypothetical protein HIM_05534 [Hirsutella minnesotensis 3608]
MDWSICEIPRQWPRRADVEQKNTMSLTEKKLQAQAGFVPPAAATNGALSPIFEQPAQSPSFACDSEERDGYSAAKDPRNFFKVLLWQQRVDAAERLAECPDKRDAHNEDDDVNDERDEAPKSGRVITLTDDAIRAALASDDAPSHFDGVPTKCLDEELRRRYQRLQDATDSVAQAVEEKSVVQERIARRSAQAQQVAAGVNMIQQRGLRRNQDSMRQRREREEIYRHVEQHLRGVASRALEAEHHAARHWDELDGLLSAEQRIYSCMRQMALTVGLGDAVHPDEIEEQVMRMSREGEAAADAE